MIAENKEVSAVKKKNILVITVAVIVLCFAVFSAFFIAAESDHDCTGNDCPICYQLSVCQSFLKNLCCAGTVAAFTAALIYILCNVSARGTDICAALTLVSMKVKLSN